MELYRTYLGKWLSLARIQSTPVSVLTISLGYSTTAQTILSYEILPLILVGMVGHAAFYAQNDILDYRHDLRGDNGAKPLTSGAIKFEHAVLGDLVLIVLTVGLAAYYMNVLGFLFFISACVIGTVYNYYSKEHMLSLVYMSTWGAFMVMTGALYGGRYNAVSVLLALAIAFHMAIMTLEGDIKDLDEDEPSIVAASGSTLKEYDGQKFLNISSSTVVVFALFEILELTMYIWILIYSYASIEFGLVLFILFTIRLRHRSLILYQRVFDDDEFKKQVVIYTLLSVTCMLVASTSFTSVLEMLMLIVASFVWGLGWQKIQYGRAFYFP